MQTNNTIKPALCALMEINAASTGTTDKRGDLRHSRRRNRSPTFSAPPSLCRVHGVGKHKMTHSRTVFCACAPQCPSHPLSSRPRALFSPVARGRVRPRNPFCCVTHTCCYGIRPRGGRQRVAADTRCRTQWSVLGQGNSCSSAITVPRHRPRVL